MGSATTGEARGGAHWELYPHDADTGVRGFGETKAQAFEQAAIALTATMTDPAGVAPLQPIHLHCEAPDDGLLLAEWLDCLIYEMGVRRMLFSRFEVVCHGNALSATAWGEPVEVARHRPAVEPKGATYTTLEVARGSDGRWVAQTVVDV
jgi:SHS2 domain-containing protein